MKLKKCVFTMTAMVSACSCLLLGGCKGSSDETTTKATQTAAENTVAPTASPEATAEATASPEATKEATTEATASPEATKEATADGTNTYKPGTLTATEYKSEYIGLEFKATDKFKLATKAQMEKAFGAGAKIMYGDKSDEVQKLSKEVATYEMMATASTGNPNVNIGVQEAMIPGMTEKDFMDAFKKQMETTQVKVEIGESKEEELCGEKYLVTSMKMSVSGQSLTERIYLRKKEDSFIFITLTGTSATEKAMEELMNNFKPCK